MKRRLLIGLAVLGVCLLAGVLAIRRSRPDPIYQGKTIKAWAMQLFSPNAGVREEATTFFRGMGTNAVPGLITLLESRDPIWRKLLWADTPKLPRRLHFQMVRHSRVPEQGTVHQAAAMALTIIGPDAKAAVPALGRVLRSGEREARWAAAAAR